MQARKKQMNNTTNHSSFDIRNKSYNKIINNNNYLIKITKNKKEFLILKKMIFFLY